MYVRHKETGKTFYIEELPTASHGAYVETIPPRVAVVVPASALPLRRPMNLTYGEGVSSVRPIGHTTWWSDSMCCEAPW